MPLSTRPRILGEDVIRRYRGQTTREATRPAEPFLCSHVLCSHAHVGTRCSEVDVHAELSSILTRANLRPETRFASSGMLYNRGFPGRQAKNSTESVSTLARKLRVTDYFTLGWGTMVGVGWLVVMDDWLGRGGSMGALLGFAIGGAALLPIGG